MLAFMNNNNSSNSVSYFANLTILPPRETSPINNTKNTVKKIHMIQSDLSGNEAPMFMTSFISKGMEFKMKDLITSTSLGSFFNSEQFLPALLIKTFSLLRLTFLEREENHLSTPNTASREMRLKKDQNLHNFISTFPLALITN